MKRFKMTFSYDGYAFAGFQRQTGGRTIQQVIEDTLERITKTRVELHASGRTDAGVHAMNQVAHFDVETSMNGDDFKRAFNSLFPKDLYVKKVEEVDENFHARYSVKLKHYEYIINTGEYVPFDRNYKLQVNVPLDLVGMQRAIGQLIGEHNFTSFCSYKEGEKPNKVRTIYDAKVEKVGSELRITLVADGFLRYMVRTIVGTLIEIGQGKRKADDIIRILDAKDRSMAAPTAPACGLYLKHVIY